MATDFRKYHRRPEGPGLHFSEDMTCGALRVETIGGAGSLDLDGRALTLVVIDGSGKILGEELFVEDLLYLPAGSDGALEYDFSGRALLIRYSPAGDEPEPIRGHVVVRMGQALGYVRTHCRGNMHGWGKSFLEFNPLGIVCTDKLWGVSRDALCQEMVMPPKHMVPAHHRGEFGREPDGDDSWQICYVWEGSARVEIGTSVKDLTSVEIQPDSVLLLPNGVAHNLTAGGSGCRYLSFQRRGPGDAANLFLDQEKDHERMLSLRGSMPLEEYLRTEHARRM